MLPYPFHELERGGPLIELGYHDSRITLDRVGLVLGVVRVDDGHSFPSQLSHWSKIYLIRRKAAKMKRIPNPQSANFFQFRMM